MADPTGAIDPVLFAALALERGLLTPAAFTLAAEACASGGPTLPEQLVLDGVITAEQRDQLLREVARATSGPRGEEEVPYEHPGRYEVTSRTGSGGQAVVMVALDRFIGREVALKILAPEGEESPDPSLTTGKRSTPHSVRFLREARVTGQLEHPNIVPVHEVGRRPDGTLYYAMRLVRGRTLSAALADCRSLKDWLRLLKPLLDVCNAIAFAHSRGVVHRDIKPANVMVGEFGETVVLDWGIAKAKGVKDDGVRDLKRQLRMMTPKDDVQTSAGLVGTPAYMSPEQAMGDVEAIDHRSDVWALGVVLYEVLAGQRPFKGAREIDTLLAISNDAPPPIPTLAPDAPRELVAVAMKALQKKPDDRYQGAKELAEELGAFMTGERVVAYEYSSLELLRRFAAKNRGALVAATLVLAVIVAALVFVTFALRRETKSLAREASARHREESALAQEHEERLVANHHLAAAYHEKAERLAEDGQHLASRLLAAASLNANPAHPKSPFYDAGFAATHRDAAELRVQAASELYRSSFSLSASLEKRFVGTDALASIATSPDGTKIAAGGADGSVTLWSLDSPGKTALSGLHGRVSAVCWSPDGRTIVAGGQDHVVVVWDAAGGPAKRTIEGHTDAIIAMRYSPDGTLVASASADGTVRLVRPETGELVRVVAPKLGEIGAIVFSPDGRTMALGGLNGVVGLADVATGKLARSLTGHAQEVNALAFSPDGTLVASAGLDRVIRLWDPSTGAAAGTLAGHRDGVLALAFSNDGALLASGGYDKTVRLWNVATRTPLEAMGGHDDFLTDIVFLPDGQRFATSSYDRSARVWRLHPGRPLRVLAGHTGAVYAVRYSPDGGLLATAGWDDEVRIWDAATGAVHARLQGHTGVIDGLAFSPDGRRLASASRDKTVRLWDTATGAAIGTFDGHPDKVFDVSISPDGRRVATAGFDGRVRLFDLETKAIVKIIDAHAAPLNQVAYAPDGRLFASTSFDHTVKLWTADGEPLRTLAGHTDWVSGLDFSPDGTLLISSGKDAAVLVWDVASGARLGNFVGHRQWVNEVRFSRDASLVGTASDDATARLWDAKTRAMKLVLRASREVSSLDFSADGKLLAMGDGNDVVLYPIDFAALDADPATALAEAQAESGLVLDGFELGVAPAGTPDKRMAGGD